MKCIIPNCNSWQGQVHFRGLCMRCYGAAKKKVEAGLVTWDRLVELGLAADPSNPFDTELAKRQEGEGYAGNHQAST